ncbi:MAG: LysR substrate-binding domain-containing protein [Lentisphaeraceae bacterium]|nr:LysR substrate-binding domain-containing protein [Lentisphaeraceae bacterium]
MNLRSLEYFVTVAKELHFNRAADICGVSQPALSIQLQKLEDELGVRLFERNNKKIIITKAGEALLSRASLILQEVKDIKSMAQNFADPYSGDLKLGAFPTLSPYLFPKIIPDLKDSYPEMKFFLYEEKTDVLLKMLNEGDVDAAFIALPIEEKYLEYEEVFAEDFLLAVPQTSSLATQKSVTVKNLEDESLLLLAEGHCLRDQALDFCQKNKVSETFDFKASSLETLRQMVTAGVGMTLIPKCALQHSDMIKYLPFSGKAPGRKIALVWRKTSTRVDVLKEVADDVRRVWVSN